MSDNEASGSVDIPDRHDHDHDRGYYHRHDFDGNDENGAKRKMPKWLTIVLVSIGGLGVVGAFAGESVPSCDSSGARSMIGDLFVQVPANTDKLTMTDLTGIREVSYEEDGKIRTCQATLLDSASVEHNVSWTTRRDDDSYYYTLEVKS